MTTTLVITVMGTDQPGLVEALSKALAAHHDNWLESRIAVLGGRFAGILLGSVPKTEAHALKEALAVLESEGLRITTDRVAAAVRRNVGSARPLNDDRTIRDQVPNGETMATKIFVNLPVKDLNRSVVFFTELGFKFDQQFTDETATCMIVSEDIFVMLLTEAKFKTFTPNPICDAQKSTEVLVCLSTESRAAVDEMVRNAVTAGGSTYDEPQDHGFMYGHGFQDLDGHIWELIYMEPGATTEAD